MSLTIAMAIYNTELFLLLLELMPYMINMMVAVVSFSRWEVIFGDEPNLFSEGKVLKSLTFPDIISIL